MALSTPSPLFSEEALPVDQYTRILKLCSRPAQVDTPALKLVRLTSLKLDLRAIQEVEAMEGYATDADFDELLFMPKVQDFLAQTRHSEQEIRSFWLLVRMRYLALLRRPQRALTIQLGARTACKPTLLLVELYRLSTVKERLRLMSRLSYQDFTALLAETDQRELPLRADGGTFLSSIAKDGENSEASHSARRMFIAR
jgi:hypothetical protein